jgi:hypothetical protein
MARPRKSAPTTSVTAGELLAALDLLQAAALCAGGIVERRRFTDILGSEAANDQLALAVQLALSGITAEAAHEALQVARVAAAWPSVDRGAALSH